jgi:hypothetical protein
MQFKSVRLGVLTALNMKSCTFWDVTQKGTNVSEEPVASISRVNVAFQRTVIVAIHTQASVMNLCVFSTFKLLYSLCL